MAKEIPYFKFYIGDWSNGDITLESFELQGVFINICAYYWSKDCSVTIDNVKKKFRQVSSHVDELITCNCLKIVGDNISISFLNEQFDSKEIQKAINRNNGSLGGRPPKEKTEEKPNGLFFENRNITNIKKSIEDKSKEESIVVGLTAPTTPSVGVGITDRCQRFVAYFNKKRGTKFKATAKVLKNFKIAIKDYSSEDLKKSIEGAMSDNHHIESNFKWLTPEFVLKVDIIERYTNLVGLKEPQQQAKVKI